MLPSIWHGQNRSLQINMLMKVHNKTTHLSKLCVEALKLNPLLLTWAMSKSKIFNKTRTLFAIATFVKLDTLNIFTIM
jgi:hypothetical protein